MNGMTINRKTAWQIVRFVLSGVVVLSTKIGLMWLMRSTGPEWLLYLFVHIIIFFVAYFLHTMITFKTNFSTKNIFKYFKAVVFIKIIDYCIFSVAFYYLNVVADLAIILATLAIGIIRFLLMRTALLAEKIY